jgi:4-hydroxybenzoate polyprenyltransferase
MKRRKDLDRPIVSRFGTPLAVFLLVFTAIIGVAIAMTDWTAALTWVALVVIVVVYDMFVVPRTKRGAFYREQILRRRTSAARL